MSEGGGNLSRRGLFTLWKRPAEKPPAPPPIERSPYHPEPPPPRPPAAKVLLRPPGAIGEDAFAQTCQRCGKCVEACPPGAIRPLADGTPAIDTRLSPCVLCADLPCTGACPSGALLPLTDLRAVRMGTAVIDAGACLAYRGSPCRACNDVCPLPGVLKLTPGKRVYVPVAGDAACVGCGLCHRYCPSEGAIRIEPPGDGAARPVRIESAQ